MALLPVRFRVRVGPDQSIQLGFTGRITVKVCKFGGTSLANAEQISKVCEIVEEDPDRRFIVVSAPGKRTSSDTKVTDLLIQCANEWLDHGKIGEAYERTVARFAEIQRDLDLPAQIVTRIADDLKRRLSMDRSNRGLVLDTLKAAGEDNCAKIFAEAMRRRGVDAHYVSPLEAGLVMSEEFGNATALPESYANLAKLRERKGVVIFPGFFGYTKSGKVATFPRGGSDITGAILAAALKADLYENFTDVDSVFAADPRIVDKPAAIEEMTYREMRELSYAGFGVFHEEAVQPAIKANVPICIKNTNHPQAPGTRVVPQRSHTPGEVCGIASSDGFCSVYIEKYLMNREIGFGRRLLSILEDEKIPFHHMPSGIDNLSVIFRDGSMDAGKEERLMRRIREELQPDQVGIEHGIAMIMIVGEGMSHSIGVAGRATTAFAQASVNLVMINQGSSEISMMFGVRKEDRTRAIEALYEEFYKKERLIHV